MAFAIKVGSAGLSFGMFVVLAQAMTPSAFGEFSIGFSIATFLSLAVLLGQRTLLLRFAAIYSSEGQAGHLKGLVRFSVILVLVASTLGITAASLLRWSLPERFELYVLLSVILSAPLAMSEMQSGLYRGLGMLGAALVPRDIIWRVLVITLALLIVYGWPMGADFPDTLSAPAALMICILTLIAALVIQILWRADLVIVMCAAEAAQYKIGEWWRSSIGLWLNTVLQSGFQHLTVVFLGVLLPATIVGGFFAALKTSILLNFFIMATNMVSAPEISRLWKRQELSKIQRLCTKASVGAIVPTVCLFTIYVLFGDKILRLFGEGYGEAYPLLIALSLGQLINNACGQTGVLMSMVGAERTLLKFVVIANLGSAALIFAGVPIFGEVFAAFAVSLGLAAWNVMAAVWSVKKLGINPTILTLGQWSGAR